ncbi:uncharacterized protein LOC121425202 [Lytechinus variegatus]|uniref:uncharacterized protein LOC121425202 n=1 Tax=Lytechinus variegatus TaxID=7654 RepID=UPI001BB0D83B|nr:uncharacterized protein LOC121425202 [Lytechinus variegatus]XP_041477143.1 uncharacterized protein LOC121425202 [Lytechinus variegatus]
MTTMIFTLLVTYNHDMTSKHRQSTEDDIGLPVLRKSISEPRLLKDVDDHRFERQHHRHAVSATPRILNTNGLSPRRRTIVLNHDKELHSPKDGPTAVAADRSIDMINPRNFPVVMTKNFLRRRANTADIHGQEETTNNGRQNGRPSVDTNGKYGSPVSGSEASDRPRGSVTRGEHGSNRMRSQLVEGKMKNYVGLPDVSPWRKSDGGSVLAAFPGNKSNLRGGRSSAISSCSWQTYPLSSRPYSNRGSKYLRGDRRMLPTNGFIPQSNSGYPSNTNSRIRTRFTTPGQREHVPHLSTNEDTSDPNNATQLPADAVTPDLVGKPTTELLQRKRATTANDLQQKNAASEFVDELVETVIDEDENRNFRVRDWLSSLDSTLCQRYARRQMASLREYELSNHKS